MQSGTYNTAPLAQGKPDPNLLLPPLSTLTPSGIGGGPTASTATSTGTPFSPQTDASIAHIMEQAGTLWAEHGPRLKDSSKAAAEQFGKLANTVLHHGEDALSDVKASMADPAKRAGLWGRYRKLILAGGAGVALFIGLGWAIIGYEASKIADDKIQTALRQAGLSSYIKYNSVSASPFGSVTLHDVRVFLSRTTTPSLKIASLSVNGLSSTTTLPPALSIDAQGIDCPLNNVSTFTGGAINGLALQSLGYTSVVGDVALSYKTSGDRISVKSSSDFTQMGGWNMAFTLNHVPPQALASLAALATGFTEQNIMMLLQTGSQLNAVELQKASLTLDNAGLVKRAKAVPDTAFPQVNTVAPKDAPPLSRWEQQGGTLSITAQQPIPLMHTGFAGYPALSPALFDLNSFIAATDARVTAN